MGFLAFHGTPHRFDRFDEQHIGSGEGRQNYGRGFYLAATPQYAERYAEAYRIRVDGEPVMLFSPILNHRTGTTGNVLLDNQLGCHGGDLGRALAVVSDASNAVSYGCDVATFREAEALALSLRGRLTCQKLGNICLVSVDSTPDQLLDIERPLDELPGPLQIFMKAQHAALSPITRAMLMSADDGNPKHRRLFGLTLGRGRKAGMPLESLLEDLGYRGIKWCDGGDDPEQFCIFRSQHLRMVTSNPVYHS